MCDERHRKLPSDQVQTIHRAIRQRSEHRSNKGQLIMTFTSILLSSVVLISQIQPDFAAGNTHVAYLASVSTYKPMAGFNHVVGPTRFAGYLLQRPGLCEVTVLTAAADDEALVSPPERMKIDIAAAGRSELPAGDGSALAIACTADADAIKIAPQYQKKLVVAP
jgi:hypothetical protein